MWGEIATIGVNLISGKRGTSQAEKQVGVNHPSVNQSLYSSDPIYRRAVDMSHGGHIASTGYQWSTNSDARVISEHIAARYAELKKATPPKSDVQMHHNFSSAPGRQAKPALPFFDAQTLLTFAPVIVVIFAVVFFLKRS